MGYATKVGSYSVVPSADLISLTAPVNAARGTSIRNATGAIGKTAGEIVIRATTVGTVSTYSCVMASGPLPADPWFTLDGSAQYQPV